MKRLLNIILIIGIIYGSLYTIISTIDIYLALEDPVMAKNIYGMDASALHWQFLSFRNFNIWQTGTLGIYIAYTLLNLVCYFKRKKPLIMLVLLADLLIIVLTIRFYYLLAQSGYDHYPGFDPYFF